MNLSGAVGLMQVRQEGQARNNEAVTNLTDCINPEPFLILFNFKFFPTLRSPPFPMPPYRLRSPQ